MPVDWLIIAFVMLFVLYQVITVIIIIIIIIFIIIIIILNATLVKTWNANVTEHILTETGC